MIDGLPGDDRTFLEGLSEEPEPIVAMAASAAKYAHCRVRTPVAYRLRPPFRPEIAAPLDFAARAEELFALDRELDRAVLGVDDLETLILESIRVHPGPGGAFLSDRRGRPGALPPDRRASSGSGELGPRRRQFVLNALRFASENARFRPPWTETLVQDAHAVLLADLGLPTTPGEFRTEPYASQGVRGESIYETCPPDRVPGELRGVLDWVDRFGATLHPVIPAAVLLLAFRSIRPFPTGSTTVGRMLSTIYLQSYGLPNVGLVPATETVTAEPELLSRLMLWTQSTGSYSEVVDFLTDRLLLAYRAGAQRWLGRGGRSDRLEEVELRLLARARRSPAWFSAQEATRWVGGRSAPTVLRHLNDLVRRGLLESLGRTRGKRYRLVPPRSVLPELTIRFGVGPMETPARRSRAAEEPAAPDPEA